MIYIDLFAALNKHRVDYVLIGGLAIALHGIERSTMDIDISVAMTPDNLNALVAMAREMGMQPGLPVPLESLGNPDLLAEWHRDRHLLAFALTLPERQGLTLDVLLFPSVDFGALQQRAVRFAVQGVPVVLACIDDLIALKKAAGRPVDLADVAHLERLPPR